MKRVWATIPRGEDVPTTAFCGVVCDWIAGIVERSRCEEEERGMGLQGSYDITVF